MKGHTKVRQMNPSQNITSSNNSSRRVGFIHLFQNIQQLPSNRDKEWNVALKFEDSWACHDAASPTHTTPLGLGTFLANAVHLQIYVFNAGVDLQSLDQRLAEATARSRLVFRSLEGPAMSDVVQIGFMCFHEWWNTAEANELFAETRFRRRKEVDDVI